MSLTKTRLLHEQRQKEQQKKHDKENKGRKNEREERIKKYRRIQIDAQKCEEEKRKEKELQRKKREEERKQEKEKKKERTERLLLGIITQEQYDLEEQREEEEKKEKERKEQQELQEQDQQKKEKEEKKRKREEKYNKQIKKVEKMWDDLGVTEDFRATFTEGLSTLSKKEKKQMYKEEEKSLQRIADYLFKLSAVIYERENTILLIKDLDITYYEEKMNEHQNEDEQNAIISKLEQAFKHLRVHSVNCVNHMKKLREIITYDAVGGKFNVDNINPHFNFNRHYLLKMKSDLDFLMHTHLNEEFNFSNNSDPFLLNLSPKPKEEDNEDEEEEEEDDDDEEEGKEKVKNDNELNDNKKRTIPITKDIYAVCKKCHFIIMQDSFYYKIQESKEAMQAKNKNIQPIQLGEVYKGNFSLANDYYKLKRDYEALFYQSQMYKQQGLSENTVRGMTSAELLRKLDEFENQKKKKTVTDEGSGNEPESEEEEEEEEEEESDDPPSDGSVYML